MTDEDAKIPPDSAWQPGMPNEDEAIAAISLLPCPFCGGEADPESWQYLHGRYEGRVQCTVCRATTPDFAAWNERISTHVPNEDAIAASVEPTWDDAVTALHNSPEELLERMGRVRTHTQALYNSEECLKEVVVWLKAHKPAIAASVASAQGGQEPSAHELLLSFGECWMGGGVCKSMPCDCADSVAAFAARQVAEAVAAEREKIAVLLDPLRERGLPMDVRMLSETVRGTP